MLIQDALTGRLHEIPDHLYGSYLGEYGQLYEPQWGEYPHGYGYSPQYGVGQVVYDGLGNPVGIFPLLAKVAPLAAKVLPAITKALPAVAQALPAVSSFLPGAAPAPPPPAMAPPPDPQVAPPPPMMAPPAPMAPMQPMVQPSLGPTAVPYPPPMVQPHFGPTAAPYPPMMAMTGMRAMSRRRRRGRRPIRRFAVPQPPLPPPPPPEVMRPATGVRTAEPSGAVQGWGRHGGFNGYGWW